MLVVVTDFSTPLAVVIFRVKRNQVFGTLTLKMTTAKGVETLKMTTVIKEVETSVTTTNTNSPSQDNTNLHGRSISDAKVALKNEARRGEEAEMRENEMKDRLTAFEKNNKLGLMEADGKLKHANKENEKLQDTIKKLKAQLEV